MIGAVMETHAWTFSRAALTLLLSDFRLGEMPRPFEAAHPYATVLDRAACRERTYRELTSVGVLAAGELRPGAEEALSALVTAPAGIVAMGTVAGGGPLLARGCWHRYGAVLAWQDGDLVRVAELGDSPLVDAVVALVPDARPAEGTSVSVRAATGRGDEKAATPPALFRDPVVGCGAFVPFARRAFRSPLTWFDTSGRRGVGRRFTTTTERDGATWTTYVPGGNVRIAAALRHLTGPLVS